MMLVMWQHDHATTMLDDFTAGPVFCRPILCRVRGTSAVCHMKFT